MLVILSSKRPLSAERARELIGPKIDTVASEWRNEEGEAKTLLELDRWRNAFHSTGLRWRGSIDFAHAFAAAALNRFPKKIQATRDGRGRWILEELPDVDTPGIRPALYNLLRDDYLGRSIALCPECLELFRITHGGKKFCSHKCASQLNSRLWWRRKGRKGRAERRASQS
jgi:hypothetical protein